MLQNFKLSCFAAERADKLRTVIVSGEVIISFLRICQVWDCICPAGGSETGNTGFTLETAEELTYHEYVFEKWTGAEVRSARIRTSAPFFSLSFQSNHIPQYVKRK